MTTIVQLDYRDLQAAIKECIHETLDELRRHDESSEMPDRCFLQEAVQVTGLKKSAIYKLTMMGDIPHEKYGKRLVFSRRELEAWMENRTIRRQTPEEIATHHLVNAAKKRTARKHK